MAARGDLPHTEAKGDEARAILCGSCGTTQQEGEKYNQCGGCKKVRYCSKACQREHWRGGHRKACKTNQWDDLEPIGAAAEEEQREGPTKDDRSKPKEKPKPSGWGVVIPLLLIVSSPRASRCPRDGATPCE